MGSVNQPTFTQPHGESMGTDTYFSAPGVVTCTFSQKLSDGASAEWPMRLFLFPASCRTLEASNEFDEIGLAAGSGFPEEMFEVSFDG